MKRMRKDLGLAGCFGVLAVVGCLPAGQAPNHIEPSEVEFKAAVQRWSSDGMRVQQMSAADNRAGVFAIAHEDIAAPILLNAVKAKLQAGVPPSDRRTHEFLWQAVDLITYNASSRGVDAVAGLCAADQTDCPWMVTKLLNHGTVQRHPFATAYDAVERYPGLRKLVLPWVEETTIKDPSMATLVAQELLNREKEGHAISDKDAITSGLSPAARDAIDQAVGKERAAEERRRRKE
jgi:hypothetical protein